MPRPAREEALSTLPLPVRRAGPLAAGASAHAAAGRVTGAGGGAAFVRLADGARVAVLPAGTPLHPWAVALAPGTPLPPDGAVVTFELADAEVPPLRIAIRPARLDPGSVAALAARAHSEVGDSAPAGPWAPRLDAALAAFRSGAAPGTLVEVLGLGPGLTPSGDDVVLGALAALDLARAASPAVDALHATLRAGVLAALDTGGPERTTALSAQLVRAAADGLHAEPVLGVLDALATGGPPSALSTALDALIVTGHRSGREVARGLVAALGRALGG